MENNQPIIIKRVKRFAAGHHGGAWKIAFADFATAMMAFFLLMWLLGNIGKEDLAGIAEYFQTPLLVGMTGGSSSSESSWGVVTTTAPSTSGISCAMLSGSSLVPGGRSIIR